MFVCVSPKSLWSGRITSMIPTTHNSLNCGEGIILGKQGLQHWEYFWCNNADQWCNHALSMRCNNGCSGMYGILSVNRKHQSQAKRSIQSSAREVEELASYSESKVVIWRLIQQNCAGEQSKLTLDGRSDYPGELTVESWSLWHTLHGSTMMMPAVPNW